MKMNSIDKQKILWKLVMALFILLISAFIFVLWSGIQHAGSEKNIRIFDVPIGATELKKNPDDELVWVTRLDQKQKKTLSTLDTTKIVKHSGCDMSTEFCVIYANKLAQGIVLRHINERPRQLPDTYVWQGGFIDPSTGAIYDLLGRAYIFAPYLSYKGQYVTNVLPLAIQK